MPVNILQLRLDLAHACSNYLCVIIDEEMVSRSKVRIMTYRSNYVIKSMMIHRFSACAIAIS